MFIRSIDLEVVFINQFLLLFERGVSAFVAIHYKYSTILAAWGC